MEGQIKASVFTDIVISERKRESTDFANWIKENCLIGTITKQFYLRKYDSPAYTSEQLYTLYLETL